MSSLWPWAAAVRWDSSWIGPQWPGPAARAWLTSARTWSTRDGAGWAATVGAGVAGGAGAGTTRAVVVVVVGAGAVVAGAVDAGGMSAVPVPGGPPSPSAPAADDPSPSAEAAPPVSPPSASLVARASCSWGLSAVSASSLIRPTLLTIPVPATTARGAAHTSANARTTSTGEGRRGAGTAL